MLQATAASGRCLASPQTTCALGSGGRCMNKHEGTVRMSGHYAASSCFVIREHGNLNLLKLGTGIQRHGVQRGMGAMGAKASIDPSKLAADIQQSRPAGKEGEKLVNPGEVRLTQPGSLQSSMAEEIDQIAENGDKTSSEGNLAESDVEPAESPAVQEAADRAAGGNEGTFKGSRLISAADGPQTSDEPAYRAATKKVVDVESEKEGDVFRGSKLISTDDNPTSGSSGDTTSSTMSSEGNLAQSDVEPAETPAVQRAADRAADMSSEGNLAQSDVEPAESNAVQRAADRAADMSSEGNLAQSDVEPAESEAVERAADRAAEGAKGVGDSAKEGLEKGESAVKEGVEKGERAVKEGAEKGEGAAKEGFAKIKEVASDVAETLDDPEKLAKKIPEPIKDGLLNATLLKESVQEKTGNLVNEFKGQVVEAKVDDAAKKVVHQAKQAAEGASDAVKEGASSARGVSQEGNLAESDVAPAQSSAVERTADALSHKQQGDSHDRYHTSQEGNLAESDVAPAESDAVERTAEALSHKQRGDVGQAAGHNTSQEGNLAESDVAPAQSAAVERTADSLSHKQQVDAAAVDTSARSREDAVKARVQQKLGPSSTTDDVGSNKYTVEVIEAHEKLQEGKQTGRPGAVGFQTETKARTAVSESSKKLDEAKSSGRQAAAGFESEAKERVQNTGGKLYK